VSDKKALSPWKRPPACFGRADRRIHPGHIRGEAGHRHLPLQARDQRIHGDADVRFGSGAAVDEDVGGVAHHRQNAFVAEPTDGFDIGGAAEKRVRVDLPIAGVQDGAKRGLDRYAVGFGDRMGQSDQLHLEWAKGQLTAKGDLR
jgi:hypothetical protein